MTNSIIWLIPGLLAFVRKNHPSLFYENFLSEIDLSVFAADLENIEYERFYTKILDEVDKRNYPLLCLIPESLNLKIAGKLFIYFLMRVGYSPGRALLTLQDGPGELFFGDLKIEDLPAPPFPETSTMGNSLLNMYILVKTLREKCPWDKSLQMVDILPLTWEEVSELWQAIKYDRKEEIEGELGDLFLHIILHSLMLEEGEGSKTNIKSVMDHLRNKLIRRHTHVFSDEAVMSGEEAIAIWERNKNGEITVNKINEIARARPSSLVGAKRVQEEARKKGFDFEGYQDAFKKVEEELEELKTAINQGENLENEFGDLLFSIVNLSRHIKVDAEGSLKSATIKFAERFQKVCELATEETILDPYKLDGLWEDIKDKEETNEQHYKH
ncbi:MAG: Nucleoside triphosphate pyrophosphohydrolase [candidate division WS2 bacterium]|nr:Nucleoside triphosphate pyrophosphohydrolase [Candidatus Psychracetigena formicireducens]MBT9137564.1 Nucleoside triphosphate pyrophosphohydrolase [Bacillota bacterium]MBT9150173.1 Nucleoside triphosphate pyrophosphohydrolase [Candidatus Psychracetigena formicireducens]